MEDNEADKKREKKNIEELSDDDIIEEVKTNDKIYEENKKSRSKTGGSHSSSNAPAPVPSQSGKF